MRMKRFTHISSKCEFPSPALGRGRGGSDKDEMIPETGLRAYRCVECREERNRDRGERERRNSEGRTQNGIIFQMPFFFLLLDSSGDFFLGGATSV